MFVWVGLWLNSVISGISLQSPSDFLISSHRDSSQITLSQEKLQLLPPFLWLCLQQHKLWNSLALCLNAEELAPGIWLLFVQNVALKKEQVVRRQLFPESLSKWNISTLIESHYVQSDPAFFVDVCLYADANEINDRGKKEICTGFMTAQKYFRAFLWEGEGTGGKRNGKWQIARMLIAFRSSLRQQSRPPTPNFSIQTKLKHFPGAAAFS